MRAAVSFLLQFFRFFFHDPPPPPTRPAAAARSMAPSNQLATRTVTWPPGRVSRRASGGR